MEGSFVETVTVKVFTSDQLSIKLTLFLTFLSLDVRYTQNSTNSLASTDEEGDSGGSEWSLYPISVVCPVPVSPDQWGVTSNLWTHTTPRPRPFGSPFSRVVLSSLSISTGETIGGITF